jgi:flavin prenyltransferase
MRLIVGITGATGAIYGIRLLEVLQLMDDVETHLIITNAARQSIVYETNYTVAQVNALASVVHNNHDIGASISSGSFRTDGMVIVPCSIKTLSGIANSFDDNLLIRAADVTLKERRRLVLAVRETPLHLGHLRLMTAVVEYGAVLMPPVPAFYTRPQTIDDLVNQTVGRILDLFGIETSMFSRWQGLREELHRKTTQRDENLERSDVPS